MMVYGNMVYGNIPGIICTINAQHSLYENVRDQLPYALEYLNTEQTRDAFPGVESFVLHCLKSIFSKNMSGLIFVKGFYKVNFLVIV